MQCERHLTETLNIHSDWMQCRANTLTCGVIDGVASDTMG